MAVPYQVLCIFQLILVVTSSPVFSGGPGFKEDSPTTSHSVVSGTDVGLYNPGLFQGDIMHRTTRANNFERKSLLWPHGVVIYRLDEKIGCPDTKQCELLKRAMNHYHTHTCIRFQEWTGEESYIQIVFSSHDGLCASAVGRQGGKQILSLGKYCWYQGTVVHELGHSIGLQHEMNRPDRDEYITINWDNILPGFADAFEKEEAMSNKNLGEEFDYQSIMMYNEFAFSKDMTSPTLETKDKTVIGPIWRKPGLSKSDVRRIRKLYSCPDKDAPQRGFPYNIYCSFNSHTCGFKNVATNSGRWQWNRGDKTEGYVYSERKPAAANQTERDSKTDKLKVPKNTTESTDYFVSVNFYGSTSSEIGCVRFWYTARGNDAVYLKLRQSFLSQPTQLEIIAEDIVDLWESEGVTETWTFLQVPLYVSNPFKLIFESSFGNSTLGVITLDEFELLYSPCGTTDKEKPYGKPLIEVFYSELDPQAVNRKGNSK